MLEVEKKANLIARMPPPEGLVNAFNSFLASKEKRNSFIPDFQAERLLQTLNVINEQEGEHGAKFLTKRHLAKGLEILSRGQGTETLAQVHNQLARRLYEKWVTAEETHEDMSVVKGSPGQQREKLAMVLCRTGDALEARSLILAAHKDKNSSYPAAWHYLLYAFARTDNEVEMLRTMEIMKEQGVSAVDQFRLPVGLFYARKDDVGNTKRWLDDSALSTESELYKRRRSGLLSDSYRDLIGFCIRNKEMEWGQRLLRTDCQFGDRERLISTAALQAAAAEGKSLEELDRMINVLVQRDTSSPSKQETTSPDIALFNGLLLYALSQQDAYLGERYFSLLQKYEADPNAETYILQVQYRIAAKDLEGAQEAYAKLRDQRIVDDEDWEAMNQLAQALAASPSTPREKIMGVIADMSEKRKVFPSQTTAALCKYHLARDEYFELVDLLQAYAFQYSIAERETLRDLLAESALNPETDTARAWDTYMIFHQIFDLETDRVLRNKIMSLMFARGRPDLATHVFTRMSRHSRANARPDINTYVLAFEGIAESGESASLEIIHNIMKLDTEVEPDTKLLTSLMLAYNAVGAPWRSFDFWYQIATSGEGASYAAVHAAFRACEKHPYGLEQAWKIWGSLHKRDEHISRELVASFVAALCGNREFDDAAETIERMENFTGGLRPDMFVIGSFYNAGTFSFIHQKRIENWCRDNYPDIWDEVEKRGFIEDEMGWKMIKGIDRTVRA